MSKNGRVKNEQLNSEPAETEQVEAEPVFQSRSEQRRIEHMQAAKASSKVKITARRNSMLPDGTFVPEGETVEVEQEYVGRLVSEGDTRFIINN